MGFRRPFHRGKLREGQRGKTSMAFATDRMKGLASASNAINCTLDVLVCVLSNTSWARRIILASAGSNSYRGTCDPNDYHASQHQSIGANAIVRLNNLCSFIPDEERAFEFGSTVWQVRVPLGEDLLLQPFVALKHPERRRGVPGYRRRIPCGATVL